MSSFVYPSNCTTRARLGFSCGWLMVLCVLLLRLSLRAARDVSVAVCEVPTHVVVFGVRAVSRCSVRDDITYCAYCGSLPLGGLREGGSDAEASAPACKLPFYNRAGTPVTWVGRWILGSSSSMTAGGTLRNFQ
jgi:hypothetical protein